MLYVRPTSPRRTARYMAAVLGAALLAVPASAAGQDRSAQAGARDGKPSREAALSKRAKRCKAPKVAARRYGRVRCVLKTRVQQTPTPDGAANVDDQGIQARIDLIDILPVNPDGSVTIFPGRAVNTYCSPHYYAAEWGYWTYCDVDVVNDGGGYRSDYGSDYYFWDGGWYRYSRCLVRANGCFAMR